MNSLVSKLSSLSSHPLVVLLYFSFDFVLYFESLSFWGTSFGLVCKLSHLSILYQQCSQIIIIGKFFVPSVIGDCYSLLSESLSINLLKKVSHYRKEIELQTDFASMFASLVLNLQKFLILAFHIQLWLEDHLYLNRIEHKVFVSKVVDFMFLHCPLELLLWFWDEQWRLWELFP